MGPPSRTSQRSASRSQYETRRRPVRTTRVPALVVTMFAPLPRRLIRRCALMALHGDTERSRQPRHPLISAHRRRRPRTAHRQIRGAARQKGAAVMARRSCDNTGAPVPRDAGRDRRVRCRRQGAAEKLGVTVGGDWPIGPVWRSRMPPRCCSSASSSSRSSSLATSSGKSNSIGSRRRPERRRSTSSTTPTASPGCRPGAGGGPASTGLGGRGRMIVAGGRRRMGFDIWPLRRRDARHSRTHEQEAQMAGRTVAVRLEARISGHHAAGPQDGHEALTVPPSPPSRRF
jgi:hypothetical protein